MRTFWRSRVHLHLERFRRHSDEVFLDRAPHKREGGVNAGHRGDRSPRPDGPRPPRLMPRAVGHSQTWHAASHLPRRLYAGTSAIGWLLQLRGQLQKSHTEEAVLCVRPLERGAQLQAQAEAPCRGQDWPRPPFLPVFPRGGETTSVTKEGRLLSLRPSLSNLIKIKNLSSAGNSNTWTKWITKEGRRLSLRPSLSNLR